MIQWDDDEYIYLSNLMQNSNYSLIFLNECQTLYHLVSINFLNEMFFFLFFTFMFVQMN
jgi:hypothetical protein